MGAENFPKMDMDVPTGYGAPPLDPQPQYCMQPSAIFCSAILCSIYRVKFHRVGSSCINGAEGVLDFAVFYLVESMPEVSN